MASSSSISNRKGTRDILAYQRWRDEVRGQFVRPALTRAGTSVTGL
jgi:hypothetical protein